MPPSWESCAPRRRWPRSIWPKFPLVLPLRPRLKPALQTRHELVRHSAVDNAVIKSEGKVNHGANGDGIVYYHRSFFDAPHSQDCDLRLIDDRSAEEGTVDPGIGHRNGPVLHVLRLQFLRARPLCQVVNCQHQPGEGLEMRIFYDRHDQS